MHKHLPRLFIFLDEYNKLVFENNITNFGIIYRNYHSKNREIELDKIAKSCKKNRIKLYVSNDIGLALRSKADGIYIPSFNKTRGFSNLGKTNLMILGSAHNQKEIKEKISQNCSIIFLAPIFFVKKKNKFLGVNKFNILSRSNKTKFLALGGINQKNISKLKLLNIKGFGGISLFKKNTGLLKAGFFKNLIF